MNKITYILSLIFSFAFFSACQPNNNLEVELKGTDWIGTHFYVNMPTYRGSDSTLITKANESNWEAVLKGKPAKIHLKNNNEYNEEHFNVNNDRILNYEGTWNIVGDSLFFDIKKPHPTKRSYFAELDVSKSILKLSKTYDADRDKQADDEQIRTFKKQ